MADCFNALTTDRTYLKSRGPEQAMSIMGHPGEAAFEPELIHVLVEDVRENGLRAA